MLNHKTNTIYHKTTYLTPPWSDPIQDAMELVENRLREIPEGQHDILTGVIEGLFNAGGKRVRPSVSLLTANIFDADINHAVSLASSIEMLHTATLIHDDLIDGAILRRGAPTLNHMWSSDIAVLTGDYMFARAATLVAEVEIIPIMKLFSKTLEIILNGEITQKFTKWDFDRREYNRRIYAKTAALFVLASHSSALLGGASKKNLSAMKEFGYSIGMAFQIVDDILDYIGSADKVGKPIGGDLQQGIFTLPVILFHDAHPNDEDIQLLLKSKEADPALVQRLINKVQDSGAIQAAMQEAQSLLAKGIGTIEHLPGSVYKNALLTLAEGLVNREM